MCPPENLELGLWPTAELEAARSPHSLAEELEAFREFGEATICSTATFRSAAGPSREVPVFVNEFWTARQRAANALHEVSYRACFKPQLPRFFIERLTRPGEVVHDPFMGRGTTPIEAALLGRVPCGSDVNPLSAILTQPRLQPPQLSDVAGRLGKIDLSDPGEMPDDLLTFYHPETLRQISALRKYLLRRQQDGTLDPLDAWIRLVAINRLTGHSPGFFSVYTLPPNQATSVKAQRRINERRGQTPPRRDVPAIILRKSRQLLKELSPETRRILARASEQARLLTAPAWATPEIPEASVSLVVTSPPFLNIVNYATDNWLRCWFAGIDVDSVELTTPGNLQTWQASMVQVFRELRRLLRPGGHVAFEVGEVRRGEVKLEDMVLPSGEEAGLGAQLVLINDQEFTKTANCWGVRNNQGGTNTNRIVLFRKPEVT